MQSILGRPSQSYSKYAAKEEKREYFSAKEEMFRVFASMEMDDNTSVGHDSARQETVVELVQAGDSERVVFSGQGNRSSQVRHDIAFLAVSLKN
jgi:hypothetical protein